VHFRTLLIASLMLVPVVGPAAAKTKWTAATSPSLYAASASDEDESDHSLYAVCPIRGIVELYVGANEQVGKGENEAVKLRVDSDGKSATLSGFSRKSYNSEMTGGTELVTRVETNHEFFKVLSSGKPIKLTGSLSKPVTWNHPGMADAVKKFMKDCAPR
jgi:hypothetical protein